MKNLPIKGIKEGLEDMAKRLNGELRVQCSSEALEWFRFNCPLVIKPMKFQIEPNPYRLYKAGDEYHYALPMIEALGIEGARLMISNPGWVTAPYELVVVYGDFGMGAFAYERNKL